VVDLAGEAYELVLLGVSLSLFFKVDLSERLALGE